MHARRLADPAQRASACHGHRWGIRLARKGGPGCFARVQPRCSDMAEASPRPSIDPQPVKTISKLVNAPPPPRKPNAGHALPSPTTDGLHSAHSMWGDSEQIWHRAIGSITLCCIPSPRGLGKL